MKQMALALAHPTADEQPPRRETAATDTPTTWADAFGTAASLTCGMTTLGGLFRVGPTQHLIGHIAGDAPGNSAFTLFPVDDGTDAPASCPDLSLWNADCATQRCLVVRPTHKGIPIAGRDPEAMRSRAGRLFYAKGMRWTSQALLAAMTERAVMGGNAWTLLEHTDMRVCKAFALWANSTLGMIVHWTRGQRTQPGRSMTRIHAMTHVPCPKLDALPDTALDRAAVLFDDLAKRELSPACQAHFDPPRHAIDTATVTILGLPAGVRLTIRHLCEQWCREPSVHGRNKTALALLSKES